MKQQLETRLSELEDLNREVKHLRGEREVRVAPLTILIASSRSVPLFYSYCL